MPCGWRPEDRCIYSAANHGGDSHGGKTPSLRQGLDTRWRLSLETSEQGPGLQPRRSMQRPREQPGADGGDKPSGVIDNIGNDGSNK